jgi:hypothetical protein
MKPRPYQEAAADFLFATDRAMILAAVGAGKTAITLTAMQDMVRQGIARRWLVLAPKRVCTDVWPVEAPKWAPGLTLAVAVGTPAQRAVAFASKADVVVANYDTIQTLPSLDGFDGVVFDELTRLKNPSGARFKDLFKKLDGMKFRWGLTGSFTSNGLEDVFGQCKVIDVDLLGRSKGAFLQTWFIPISREFGQWVARPSALAGIMAKIKPATFVLDAGEYSDKLPPLNVVEVRSTMDMKAYDRMKRDYVAQVGGETVTALTAAAVTSKLQQLAGGWAYSPSPVWFSSHRFDRLEELLAENQRANTLVVYNYREELAELKRRYPQAQTLDDADAIKRWNAGQIEMLLVHPKCLHPETEVLTEYRGWVPIVDVLASERVFDGVEYVSHSGCVYSGHETVVERFGIRMTPAHRLLVDGAWVEAKDVGTDSDTERKARYDYTGSDARLRALFAVRRDAQDAGAELATARPQRGAAVPRLPTRPDASTSAESVGGHASSLSQPQRQGLRELRRPGHISMRALAFLLQRFLLRHGPNLRRRYDVGTARCERGLRAGQLPVGLKAGAASQQAHDTTAGLRGTGASSGRAMSRDWIEQMHTLNEARRRSVGGRGGGLRASVDIQEEPQTSDVYDLVDCGPRSRFVIRNAAGEAFISHNSAGHGLNLQHGGSHIVFVSLPWSLELFEQTVGRLHRSGQKHPVYCYVMITEKTIDERIWQSLHDKRSLSQLATEELAA